MDLLEYITRNRLAGYLLSDVRKIAMSSMLNSKRKLDVFMQIKGLLEGEGIRVIALKGVAMMVAHYDDISQRPIGDLDILIEEKDVYRAQDILIKNGAKEGDFQQEMFLEEENSHLKPLIFNEVIIELHKSLFRKGSALNPKVDVFSKTKFYKDIEILDDEMMAYHLACHAFSHLCFQDIRLIWIIDIERLIAKNDGDFMQRVIEINPVNKRRIKRVMRYREKGRKWIWFWGLGLRFETFVRTKGALKDFFAVQKRRAERSGKSLLRTYIDYFIHFR